MKEKINRPVIVSTLSTLVAVGVTALVYGRKVKQDKPIVLSSDNKKNIVTKKFTKRAMHQEDVYEDDNDLGYC